MEKIRVGVFGLSRGVYIAREFVHNGAEIVAFCDLYDDRIAAARAEFGENIPAYKDFDRFLEHPMDAVILTNNFSDHAPYAVKCLAKNIHVLSECISNGTMAEGVALVRAFEKSKAVYMMAENYPQSLLNTELKRVADGGTLGKIVFAESEYNHPLPELDPGIVRMLMFTPRHWRNFLPKTYYITHSLGPVMYMTGATPKKVSAFAVFDPVAENAPSACYVGDRLANITTQNDDGSVFRVTAFSQFGGHNSTVRLCGTKGQAESLRGQGDKVLVRYNDWDLPENTENNRVYTPEWNDKDAELIKKSEHGGGDFKTVRLFLECIREKKQPPMPFDVYSSTVMSSVAILGHRSVLNGGKVYDIPDFRNEADRALYENDDLTPFWREDGRAPTVPCCSHPDYKPSEKQLKLYAEAIKDNFK